MIYVAIDYRTHLFLYQGMQKSVVGRLFICAGRMFPEHITKILQKSNLNHINFLFLLVLFWKILYDITLTGKDLVVFHTLIYQLEEGSKQ